MNAKHKVVKSLVDSSSGTFMSAWFVKKDGSVRHMLARTEVSKGVTGAGRTFDPDDKELVGVLDVEEYNRLRKEEKLDDKTAAKKSYRFISSNTVFALKIRGHIIRVGEKPEGFEFPEGSVFADAQ